jgi:hypothetical protein
MTPTDADLARWAAMEKAATEGPWGFSDDEGGLMCLVQDEEAAGDVDLPVLGRGMKEVDADLCAESRTAVPALIAEVRRLRGALEGIIKETNAMGTTSDEALELCAMARRALEPTP